ncbi:MAG: PEP-CTERM sorting domain-containing protein [Planctomycetota bacterium]
MTTPFDPVAVDVAPGAMEATFGPKTAELDAKAYGFNFLYAGDGQDDPFHGHRNLNVITEVFVADQPVAVGGVVLQPGDFTFAYTLDYSQLDGLVSDSAVQDFQILRTVVGINPSTDNPGPRMAIDAILGGGTNIDAAFGGGGGTAPLEAYPDGMVCEAVDYSTLVVDMLEYSWDAELVAPETLAMVLLFTSPVEIRQVGWGSQHGQAVSDPALRDAIGPTAEGGGTIGGGQSIPDSIPVLIPAVPEPATLALLALGGAVAGRRRRR